MIIKDMFVKSITRDIKGVIKVGQGEDANIKQELEEYVVTRELQKHFSTFFNAYKRGILGYTDNMGVWISGFFGSGKSHFLKILSYLLENREVDGKHAIDYFEEDNKISDSMVLADMKLAASTPTDVILFNVDSKSEMAGKQNKDAIVSVFLKVFNEMQGFYGGNPHIADLERRLTYDGRYEEFKQKFEEANGDSWLEARNEFDYSQDDVVDVLVDMDFMSEEAARNWCEKAFTPYAISIEDFAEMVKKYLSKKGKNHHIVFLVDEIGQYIGEDSRLMLNLQTVTEDLGTACKGKAWIVVTSQQDIDSVIKVRGNDFSKIMGRFNTRLSLSSANVDEVIKKRILAKTPVATQTLSLMYDTTSTILKNLILFNDGIEKKVYSNRENFAEVYPFVPYQFNLLGDVLTEIRTHGASGKSLADGARSMLALFKESAERIKDCEPGTLAPFNFFYDALEAFIEHNHRDVITRALDNDYINPDHEKENFSVNVLKVLFMIKYVKTIKANINNITTLMVSSVDDDRLALSKKVEESLKILEKQTLVQKNNDVYVFLTNEEQDIRRAIEKQLVDSAEITNKVAEMIFDGIFTDKKYRYPAFNGRYNFPFNQMVDDRPYKGSTGYDLTVRILTPGCEESTDDQTMRLMSGQSNVVLVILPDDRTFLDEIIASAKIEKFLRFDATNAISKYEEIKAAKRVEMREHSSRAKTFLDDALRNAKIYAVGNLLQTTTKDVSARINEALGKLVDTVYHKLNYITAAMGETEIRSLLKANDSQIMLDVGDAEQKNQLALNDARDYVSMVSTRHTKASMKNLMDRFIKAPYGFVEDDVKWLVAKLFKMGDIALYVNSEAITLVNKSTDDLMRFITRKEYYEKLMMEKREKVSEKHIKAVREVMRELFGVSTSAENEDALMNSFVGYAQGMKRDLELLEIHYQSHPEYPGKKSVNSGKKLLIDAIGNTYVNDFYAVVFEKQDDFIEFAEEYDPIKQFFAGDQKKFFDDATEKMKIYDESKTYIVNRQLEAIVKDIKNILKMEVPFGQIHKLPDLVARFSDLYASLLDIMAEPVYSVIKDARNRVFEELSGKKCETVLSGRLSERFNEIQYKAEHCNNVATLQGIRQEADALKIRSLTEIAETEAKIVTTPDDHTKDPPHVKRQKTISIKSVAATASWQIETIDDIDTYLAALRKRLINTLEDDTVTHIEF